MASEKIIAVKQQQVTELKEKMQKAVAGVVVDYRGISVANDTKLRKELREAGVEYNVIKNNIVRRAAEEAGLGEMSQFLTGTTAFALSDNDPIVAAKILNKYAEGSKGKYTLKGGFMEGKVMDAQGVEHIAKLPGKTELLTMLCMALNGNIRGLAVALNAVVEKQSETATA